VREASQGQTIAAIERAADVLTLFVDSRHPSLGVTEIAQGLGLSKAVVHRILASLRSRAFVSLDEDSRRYVLGPRALALGLAYLDRIDVRGLARPVLEQLSAATDETATCSVRAGQDRIYVDQVTPARDIKMVVPIGAAFPLHAGGSSKAFLAYLPEAEQEAYLNRPLAALTDLTVTDPGSLRAELAEIRARGYAVSYGERQEGAASVAAPLFDHEGGPVAVISLCGPVERFRAEVETAAKLLTDATGQLSAKLGHRVLG
jgi:DNA-binding IclR family transcriptional regulator